MHARALFLTAPKMSIDPKTYACISSVHQAGFMADVSSDMWGGRNWRELTRWRTSGFKPGFLKDFTYSNGRFTAKTSGVYSFHANIRIDSANTGYFRAVIAKKNSMDVNNGIQAINGDPSDNYNTINMGGKMKLNKGDVRIFFIPQSLLHTLAHHRSRTYVHLPPQHAWACMQSIISVPVPYHLLPHCTCIRTILNLTVPATTAQFVSVWVYASSDNSWNVQGESGFSGAYVGPLTVEGFQVRRVSRCRPALALTLTWFDSLFCCRLHINLSNPQPSARPT